MAKSTPQDIRLRELFKRDAMFRGQVREIYRSSADAFGDDPVQLRRLFLAAAELAQNQLLLYAAAELNGLPAGS